MASSVSRIRIGIITVSVAGSRVANMCATDSLVAQLRPQSKVTICFRKIPSCTHQRLVQAELLADRVDLLRRGVQAAEDLRRVAAEELEQEEDQQHDAEQRRDHLPEAAQEIGGHADVASEWRR